MKQKKQITKKSFDCRECNTTGSVKMIHTFDGEYNTVLIKKCTHCKHQYYLKQLFKLESEKATESA